MDRNDNCINVLLWFLNKPFKWGVGGAVTHISSKNYMVESTDKSKKQLMLFFAKWCICPREYISCMQLMFVCCFCGYSELL